MGFQCCVTMTGELMVCMGRAFPAWPAVWIAVAGTYCCTAGGMLVNDTWACVMVGLASPCALPVAPSFDVWCMLGSDCLSGAVFWWYSFVAFVVEACSVVLGAFAGGVPLEPEPCPLAPFARALLFILATTLWHSLLTSPEYWLLRLPRSTSPLKRRWGRLIRYFQSELRQASVTWFDLGLKQFNRREKLCVHFHVTNRGIICTCLRIYLCLCDTVTPSVQFLVLLSSAVYSFCPVWGVSSYKRYTNATP